MIYDYYFFREEMARHFGFKFKDSSCIPNINEKVTIFAPNSDIVGLKIIDHYAMAL